LALSDQVVLNSERGHVRGVPFLGTPTISRQDGFEILGTAWQGTCGPSDSLQPRRSDATIANICSPRLIGKETSDAN